MNIKKLLPATIGAILAGGMAAAQADVQVFGHIDQAIVNKDIDSGNSADDDTNFVCTTCSVGFKGSEDLGNGLKAIFKLDFQYDINVRNDGDGSGADGDNNNSGLLDRDQWVGLKGSNWGQVRIGTISTPYKSTGAKIDPMYRTAVQARSRGLQSNFHLGAGEELEGRATNTARYDSPSWNGLQVAAHFTLDSADTTEDNNPYGLGVSYDNAGIFVFANYQTNDGDDSGSGDLTAWKVGGKYTLNNFAIFGQYEDSEEDDNAAAAEGLQVWHVGGTFTMGSNTLYAAYGQGTAEELNGNDEDYTTWSVGGMHKMSKRTMVYAAYTATDCDANMNNIYESGLDVSVCSSVEDNGGDNEAFALGLKHKF
jgi:predicted porin